MSESPLPAGGILVDITTSLGAFQIAVFADQAPITARNFLSYLDGGYLAEGSVYRIATPQNEAHKPVHIDVLQFGWKWLEGGRGAPIPPIPLESTQVTGLRHVQGTVSTARFEVDNGGYGFFICMRDEPELDFGGRRHPDGQGFAAFGRVVSGWEVIEAIRARAEDQDMLSQPIALLSAARQD